jgi:enterochelin esterase family protein
VFVSHGDAALRHRVFACSADFSGFIVEELLPELRRRFPTLAPGGHQLLGLSLSGLAAAHLALTHPDHFPAAVCQSPSFWWNDEAFRRQLLPAGTSRPRLWVSVGNQETTAGVAHPPTGLYQGTCQLDSCRRTADDLRQAGYAVAFREYDGGHDLAPWIAELPDALRWLDRPQA